MKSEGEMREWAIRTFVDEEDLIGGDMAEHDDTDSEELVHEMRRRVIRAMIVTWDVIGADVVALGTRGLVEREVVIEMVTDAGRMLAYGDDLEAAKVFYSLSDEEKADVAKEAFPCGLYE